MKGMRKPGCRRSRRGAITVMSAFGLVAIVGSIAFATDLGMVVVRKQKLQGIVDAAAMEGGLQFGKFGNDSSTSPEAMAKAFGKAHGCDIALAKPSEVHALTTAEPQVCPGSPNRLDLVGEEDVETFFLKLFRKEPIHIEARSSVKLEQPDQEGPINRIGGTISWIDANKEKQTFGVLAPFALNAKLFDEPAISPAKPQSFANLTRDVPINLEAKRETSGEPAFWLASFTGSSQDLKNHVGKGFEGTVRVSDTLTVEPLTEARLQEVAVWLTTRIAGTTADESGNNLSWRPLANIRRILVVPVVRATGDSGKVTVDGFAGLEVVGDPQETKIVTRLVNAVVPSAVVDPSLRASAEQEGLGHHYGLYTFHLVNWKASK